MKGELFMQTSAVVGNENITVKVAVNDKNEVELKITDSATGKLIQHRALGPDVDYDD